jgi:uncharacterized protein (TIGR02284 family)
MRRTIAAAADPGKLRLAGSVSLRATVRGRTNCRGMSTKSISSTLNTLIETCRDGEEGFRVAAGDVKNAELKTLFTEYSQQRARFIPELQSIVDGLGQDAEETSSVAGALHRGWINIKSVIAGGDEHAILSECERGEDHAVDAYQAALSDQSLPVQVREVVQRQYVAVQAAHDRVRDLRDAMKS